MNASAGSVDNDGVRIAFDERGEGPAVFFLHGMGESRESWTAVTDLLVHEMRCIRLDFRGHGESERCPKYDVFALVTDLQAVIDATGATAPIVVGHSLGGMVATIAAATAVAGPVICIDQPLELRSFGDTVHQLAPRLLDPATFEDARREEREALGFGQLPQSQQDRIEHANRSSDPQVLLDIWKMMLEGDDDAMRASEAGLAALVEAIKPPYLAVHGLPVVTGYADWLRSHIPGASFEMWADHGHWLHLVDPERFAARVRQFIA